MPGVGMRGAVGIAGAARGGVGAAAVGAGALAAGSEMDAAGTADAGTGGVCIAANGVGALVDARVAATDAADLNSVRTSVPAAIVITPPHTEQRARTLVSASFAGSTRNTERHSGHVTFIEGLPPARRSWSRRCASLQPAGCRYGGQSNRPSHRGSSRNSSFPLRVH